MGSDTHGTEPDTDGKPRATRSASRQLIVALGTYWLFWGVTISIAPSAPGPVAAVSGVLMIVGGVGFFVTLFSIWKPVTGISFAAMMVPSLPFSRRSRGASRVMISALRPSWWRMIVKASEWPGGIVVVALAVFLIGDLVVFAHMATVPAPTRGRG